MKWSKEFIKETKKDENTFWVKSIGWLAIVGFAGYKAIDNAFKTGIHHGALIMAEECNKHEEEKEEN